MLAFILPSIYVPYLRGSVFIQSPQIVCKHLIRRARRRTVEYKHLRLSRLEPAFAAEYDVACNFNAQVAVVVNRSVALDFNRLTVYEAVYICLEKCGVV